jgi:hypothetical protein
MNYLIILISLVVFFSVITIYLKKKNSTFNKTTLDKVNQNYQNTEQQQIYKLDTRYDYPLNPPVNPIVYKSVVLNSVPVSKDLYSNQEMNANGYILNENINESNGTNQLNYSGGSTQLIKIPLQFNEPYNEQLRTQDVLITPYNKIKYGMNC